MIELLSAQDYRRTPWKNGNGITEDVLLLPEGASHDGFDIRVSRAPIVDESRFSPFPGIDRTITRIGEKPLVLCFSNGKEVVLEHLSPVSFDSNLAPTSRLPSGASQVMNVMTRRGRWTSQVTVLRETGTHSLPIPQNGLVVVHVVAGSCDMTGTRAEAGETLVARDMEQAELALGGGSACLVAMIAPASGL
jgi:environmental stress-induced protein Ves